MELKEQIEQPTTESICGWIDSLSTNSFFNKTCATYDHEKGCYQVEFKNDFLPDKIVSLRFVIDDTTNLITLKIGGFNFAFEFTEEDDDQHHQLEEVVLSLNSLPKLFGRIHLVVDPTETEHTAVFAYTSWSVPVPKNFLGKGDFKKMIEKASEELFASLVVLKDYFENPESFSRLN